MGRSYSQQNSINLDPNREKISKQMATVPGSPENTQMANPMNFTSYGPQASAMPRATANGNNSEIINEFAYGDKGLLNDPRLGADALNPAGRPQSDLYAKNGGFFVAPGRGLNTPYGLQQQADISGVSPVSDGLESQRLVQPLQQQGLPVSPMGLGSMAGKPGELPPNMPGTTGQPLMQGVQAIQPPGTTPQKLNAPKQKKGKA